MVRPSVAPALRLSPAPFLASASCLLLPLLPSHPRLLLSSRPEPLPSDLPSPTAVISLDSPRLSALPLSLPPTHHSFSLLSLLLSLLSPLSLFCPSLSSPPSLPLLFLASGPIPISRPHRCRSRPTPPALGPSRIPPSLVITSAPTTDQPSVALRSLSLVVVFHPRLRVSPKIGLGACRQRPNSLPVYKKDADARPELSLPRDRPIALSSTAEPFAPRSQHHHRSSTQSSLSIDIRPAHIAIEAPDRPLLSWPVTTCFLASISSPSRPRSSGTGPAITFICRHAPASTSKHTQPPSDDDIGLSLPPRPAYLPPSPKTSLATSRPETPL
ncbi:hypothetical protein CDD83_589 [Cordyceps sp. RAO-2017]|nr:hypothetical protein CDD83_589 [Cordyceps sp. RAO-2017]